MLYRCGDLRCGSRWSSDYNDVFGRDVDSVSRRKERGEALE